MSYQFTWARNPTWTQYYSGAAEIWRYMNDIVAKYGLRKFMKFGHTVVGANWSDGEGLWHLRIQDAQGIETIDKCDVLINGSGHLK